MAFQGTIMELVYTLSVGSATQLNAIADPTGAASKLNTYVEHVFYSASTASALNTALFTPAVSSTQPTTASPNPDYQCTDNGTSGSNPPVDGGQYVAIIKATTPSTWPGTAPIYIGVGGQTGLQGLGDWITWNPNNGGSGANGQLSGTATLDAWGAAVGGQPTNPPLITWNSPPTRSGDTFFSCFMHGTIFRTLKDNTEVPIEIQNLKVGDLVKTEVFVNQKECQFSLEAWQRIKRMIRRPMTADEYANKTRILPKDALGPGKPDKDLHVTWGHGLLLKEIKEEWKNDEYDGDHVTYSKEHALVKGDFIKLLAGHCALCRKPNEEENKKAGDEREKRAYYHLMLEDKEEKSQHALVTHGVTSESLVRL